MALIKMRVLHDSKKKGMAQFAKVIADKYELSVNATSGKFPPEYPCDKERIVILGLSAKVKLVAPKSITRSEGKAVRVIDKRKI